MWGKIYNFFRNIKNTLLFFLFLAFGLSMAVAYITPLTLVFIAPFGLLFLPLFVATLGVFLIYMRRNKTIAFIALALLFCSYKPLKNTIQFHPTGEKKGIKVMTWNVKNFDLYNWTKNKQARREMFDIIDKLNPDILCLQEFYTDKKEHNNIKALQNKGFKYFGFFPAYAHTKDSHQWGLAIFSKHPISNTQPIRLNPKKSNINQGIKANIQVGGKDYTIYNAHFQSIHLDYSDLKHIEEVKKEWKTITDMNSWKVLYKIISAYKSRAIQVNSLMDRIESTKAENIILCCDMNDIPTSYAYHTIQQSLTDAFVERGTGLSNTVSIGLPIYRIDYIFGSQDIKINHYQRIKNKLSDHHIIMAYIE